MIAHSTRSNRILCLLHWRLVFAEHPTKRANSNRKASNRINLLKLGKDETSSSAVSLNDNREKRQENVYNKELFRCLVVEHSER